MASENQQNEDGTGPEEPRVVVRDRRKVDPETGEARAAGVVPGDRLLAIDGEPVEHALRDPDRLRAGATNRYLVRRAHDEVEHGRDVARLVLRNRERQLVREAAREVEGGEEELAEQLDELEEHVYLCLITINRSRRMVAQEMMGEGAPPPPPAASAACPSAGG